MPSSELIVARPDSGLVAGIMPSIEPASGAIWKISKNCWFREASIENNLGRTRVAATTLQTRFLANAFTAAGQKRLFYEDSGVVRYYNGTTTVAVDSLANNGTYWLEPWGDWLLATDYQNNLKLWKNTGGFITITDAATQFAKCRIVKKLAQHVLAYNTDVFPSGFHWSTANDPEIWTPSTTNSARNLPIRGLDSEIVCVADLGASHAVYSRSTLLLVRYVGPTQWFGTPQQALQGIGAVSALSSVSVGALNYGLCRDGVFVTDGNSFQYIDRPAIDRWIQEQIDWSKASEIAGFYNARLQLVSWTVPLLIAQPESRAVLAVDTKRRELAGFTFLEPGGGVGLRREVFDFPARSYADGVYLVSQPGTIEAGGFSLTSHLLDGKDKINNKSWDYAVFDGTLSGEVRFGFADEPKDSLIEWMPWQTLTNHVPFGPREAMYIAVDLRSSQAIRLTGMAIYGEQAGAQQ